MNKVPDFTLSTLKLSTTDTVFYFILVTFVIKSSHTVAKVGQVNISLNNTEAVFLVVCDPSMNEQ